MVTAVIPTKSNIVSLLSLVIRLHRNPLVSQIIVIADGSDALTCMKIMRLPVTLLSVKEEEGIHTMWNMGLDKSDGHVLFINDDVRINKRTISGLIDALTESPELGLVCPTYSSGKVSGRYKRVEHAFRDGHPEGDGLAGFCMLLRDSLAREWRFDTRMKWRYGDDDLVKWVTEIKGMVSAITPLSSCSDNCSWTVINHPPNNFDVLVEQDKLIFEEKWSPSNER